MLGDVLQGLTDDRNIYLEKRINVIDVGLTEQLVCQCRISLLIKKLCRYRRRTFGVRVVYPKTLELGRLINTAKCFQLYKQGSDHLTLLIGADYHCFKVTGARLVLLQFG